MSRTKSDKFDDYLGIPIHRDLKKRIQRIAGRKDPKPKMIPMARSLLTKAIEQEEQAGKAE